jgi:hypothetical protein
MFHRVSFLPFSRIYTVLRLNLVQLSLESMLRFRTVVLVLMLSESDGQKWMELVNLLQQ